MEWLGEVPVHWALGSLKHLAWIRNGRDYKDVESPDGEYPVIGSGGQFANAIQYLYDGESVLLGRKGTIDKPLYIHGRFWTVDTMFYTEVSSDASAKFLYYNALTIPFQYYSTSTALPSMTQGDLLNHPCAIPTLKEQTQIARFLDHETARIDELIEEQQRLIELLKEKRQAVISHAVTKGLDPTVLMKDSGVEWLGEVPMHWPLPKLGHLARVLNGSTPSRENMDYWSEGNIPWIASGSLNDYRIDLASEYITEKALKECSVEMIPRGAILVGLVGQGKTRGLAALLNIDATINQNVCAVIPDKEKVLSGFLHLYLHCVYEPLRDFGRGANQAALNCELVSALRIPLPCMEEQGRIVRHIESKLNEFDALEDYALRSIGLMQERRSALISAAVTGKIDVRGWQPPASATSPELAQEAV
ncbi:restriction endonuclease subunit S [Pseudomonas sp. LD120]|uniref:restriction endonuclease subunit S n=1 Tax=Pseudomonas sp. LD120 TaxID=485751 RepID=UPI0013570928|nr:restriction endonuclease subunit S [Pseudomonas sp. LD120]